MQINSHPLRHLVVHELHARPYVRFPVPAHVYHFTFLDGDKKQGEDKQAQWQAGLFRLREQFNLLVTYDTPRHSIYTAVVPGLARLVVAWEPHSEYLTFTLFFYELENPCKPLGLDILALLPSAFVDNFGSQE